MDKKLKTSKKPKKNKILTFENDANVLIEKKETTIYFN